MSSPFPGMDPWLEEPSVWPGFHLKLITETVAAMQPQLRARGYYIDSGERIWLAGPRWPVYPENAVFEIHGRKRPDDGPVAVLEPDEPVRVKHAGIEIREGFLDVFDTAGHQLVTGIEFVSPANKSDAQGRELYQQKQLELRAAGVPLVEVDFIRRGPQVLDVPEEVVEKLKPWAYLANLVRRGSAEYEVYPITLRHRLPRIRIPLKIGDEDAVLDLQDVFNRSYEIGPYPERLNYPQPPQPPLSDDDEQWADQLLKQKGLRE